MNHAAKLALCTGIALTWPTSISYSSPLERAPRATFEGHTESVESVAISPNGKMVASGSADDEAKLWDIATGKNIASFPAGKFGSCTVAFSPDGKTLASAGGGVKITLWNLDTLKSNTLVDKASLNPAPFLAFSPDGKLLATGGMSDREIRLYDLAAGKCALCIDAYDGHGARALAFAPDSKTLVSVGHHDGIKRWDVATGKRVLDPPRHEAAPKLIAQLGARDFRARQHAYDELKKLGRAALPVLRDAARSKLELEVKRRVQHLLSEIDAGTLNEADDLRVAAFSPDLKTLAAATWDKDRSLLFNLWDTATGIEADNLKRCDSHVCSLAYSPDGKILAAGREDGAIKLWDPASGMELARLKGHSARVWSLAFSADSTMLVSGSEDKTIKTWTVPKTR
jgi:WD40 repeat protein